jgi:(2Fe-2S) ferredoxin
MFKHVITNVRRKLTSELERENPVLAFNELAVEILEWEKFSIKKGNGSLAWADLPYWYKNLNDEDVNEIIDDYLINGGSRKPSEDFFAMYGPGNGLKSGKTPSEDDDVARKIDTDNKLDKDSSETEFDQAYVKTSDGKQAMYDIDQAAPSPNTVARRGSAGELKVGTPWQGEDAANKAYVDSHTGGEASISKVVIPVVGSEYTLHGVQTIFNIWVADPSISISGSVEAILDEDISEFDVDDAEKLFWWKDLTAAGYSLRKWIDYYGMFAFQLMKPFLLNPDGSQDALADGTPYAVADIDLTRRELIYTEDADLWT